MDHMQKVSDDFMRAVAGLFSNANSPKRQRESLVGQVRNPFGEEESNWLEVSLSATMNTFGGNVDRRFKRVEEELTQQRTPINNLETEVEKLMKAIADGAGVDGNASAVDQQRQDALVVRITEAEKQLATSLCTASELGGQMLLRAVQRSYLMSVERRSRWGTWDGTMMKRQLKSVPKRSYVFAVLRQINT